MGILTSSTKERLEALEDQRKKLQARIAEERLAKPKMKEEFVRFWLLRFRKLDMTQPEQRQALVDTFINAIYLYDDKVLITFNYKEGTETVAFGEAVKAEKSSDMSARGGLPDAGWGPPCCPEPLAFPLPSRWCVPAWTSWGCPQEQDF